MRALASKKNAAAFVFQVCCTIACDAPSDEQTPAQPAASGAAPDATPHTPESSAASGSESMSGGPSPLQSGTATRPDSPSPSNVPGSSVPATTTPTATVSDAGAEPATPHTEPSVVVGSDAGSGATSDAAVGVTRGIVVEGRQVLIGAERLHLRGVNWNPVPKGATHPAGLDFAGFAETDVSLMQSAGINAVRTYEPLLDRAVLDQLHAAGIYVFCTVYGWWQDEPSVVTARVDAVKDHPAILAWVLGNEWNYNHLYGYESSSWEQTRDRINAAAELVKLADPLRPVATVYGEFERLEEALTSMPDVDLWGINAYRGLSFGDLFSRFETLSSKPLFLGEYGADAFNATLEGGGAYDPMSQADAVHALTLELLENSSAAGGVALGGFVFEWADEWWKAEGSPDVQDSGGVAPGGGPHPDGTFNEEWWGVVDIERVPRPAYDALRELFQQGDAL